MKLSLWVAWNEVVRLCRIRTILLMLLGLPLILIFLLGNALESDFEPVDLSVYAGDRGPLSESAERYLTNHAIDGYANAKLRGSDEEVREDVRSGKADFGFSLTDEGVRYYPGPFTERNLVAESVLNRFVENAGLSQSAAVVLGLTGEKIAATLSAVPGTERLQIGNLVTRDNTDFNNFSAVQYYSVAYLIMFLMYSGLSVVINLGEEREKGTLLRLYSMPVSLNVLLFGKMMGVALFAFLQAAVIVGFTHTVYGVDWGSGYGTIALVCALVSAATIGFAIVICSFLRNRRAIESIFSLLVTVMTFLSGGMIADLGQGMREAGKFTLNHWANEVLRQTMAGGTLGDSWRAASILAAITAAIVAAAMLRFRKAVALT